MRVSDLNIDRIYINQTTRASSYHMTENHYHYYYELFYVRQGTCRFFLNNGLYDLHGGDFLIIPPHMVHYNRYLTSCLRINVYFKESDLVREGAGFLPDVRERFLCLVLVHIPAAYRDMMDGICEAMLQEEKVDDANTRMMMDMFLKPSTASATASSTTSPPCPPGPRRGMRGSCLQRGFSQNTMPPTSP